MSTTLRCAMYAVLPLAITAGCAADAQAQVNAQSYFLQHNFSLTPGGNLLPSVVGRWYDHAWVNEPGHNVFSASPAAQPGGWAPFGFDWLLANSTVQNSGGVFANRGAVAFPPAGGLKVDTASVPAGPSSAFARSTIQVNPYGVGGPVTGIVRSEGNVLVFGRGNSAFSFSSASVEVRGRAMYRGRILWGPILRDFVGGSVYGRVDPVYMKIEGVDGEVRLEASLLDIHSRVDGPEFGPENRGFTWENNIAIVTAPEVDFDISLPGQFTQQRGLFHMQVRGGVLATAERTGIFANVQLPPIGTPIPFEFQLPSLIQLDFNLPTNLGDQVVFEMGGGANDTPIGDNSCLADFNGDGAVDFFDYLDFALAFSNEDASADINGDGAVDFFDYLDFVSAFDQGCP